MVELDSRQLTNKLNVILTSDHGMAEISNERTVNLGAYVDFTADVAFVYLKAIGLIHPKQGKLDKVSSMTKSTNSS